MANGFYTFDVGAGASQGLQALQGLLTGGRSCMIQVENNSSLILYRSNVGSNRGGFAVAFPADKIEPGKGNIFGHQKASMGIATGSDGWVSYEGTWVDLPTGDPAYSPVLWFCVRWDNPYVGSNKAFVQLAWSQNSIFKARYKAGAGDTSALFIFKLYDANNIRGPQIQEL